MIIWTFGLVLFFGIAVGFTVLQPPSTLSKTRTPASDRMPASVPALAAVPQQINLDPGAQVSDFKVGCEPKATSDFAATIQQVRLRGDTCAPSKKARLRSAQIRNLTNGFMATVFTGETNFTTDYINLRAGENEIQIDMVFTDGSRQERKLHFTRTL